jgi:hypothetical protein
MLNALRDNRKFMEYKDIDMVINKIMVGWQPTEHQFTSDIIDHIAVHELGHAILGLLSKHHTKMSKVIINLYSPKSPAYTVFESSTSSIYTREGLFEHLMILLGGRIAEEIIYGVSVTTGAINDFKEAKELAEKMITYYGLGKSVIYPDTSEKYRQKIDDDVADIINEAYGYSKMYLEKARAMILEGSELLKKEKTVKAEKLIEMMETKYPEICVWNKQGPIATALAIPVSLMGGPTTTPRPVVNFARKKSAAPAPVAPLKPIWMTAARQMLSDLFRKEDAWIFLRPVDPVKDLCPDYLTVIKEPMDFATIRRKMAKYNSKTEFVQDIELVFTNCKTYNKQGTLPDVLCTRVMAFWNDLLERYSFEQIPDTNSTPRKEQSAVSDTTMNEEIIIFSGIAAQFIAIIS